jgi:hypothetical protein
MVKAIINICHQANHVLNIVKAKHKFKDKSETLNYVLLKHGQDILHEDLTPEFMVKYKLGNAREKEQAKSDTFIEPTTRKQAIEAPSSDFMSKAKEIMSRENTEVEEEKFD